MRSYSGLVSDTARIWVNPILILDSFHHITAFPRKVSHVLLSDVRSTTITDLFLWLISFPLLNADIFAISSHCSLEHREKDIFIFGKNYTVILYHNLYSLDHSQNQQAIFFSEKALDKKKHFYNVWWQKQHRTPPVKIVSCSAAMEEASSRKQKSTVMFFNFIALYSCVFPCPF